MGPYLFPWCPIPLRARFGELELGFPLLRSVVPYICLELADVGLGVIKTHVC